MAGSTMSECEVNAYHGKEEFGPKIDMRSAFEYDRAVLVGLVKDLRPDKSNIPRRAAVAGA